MEIKNKDLSFKLTIQTKENIRSTKLAGIEVGGDLSIPFVSENGNKTKPLLAIEFPFFLDETYPELLKDIWSSKTPSEFLKKADQSKADIISIKFNVFQENFQENLEKIKIFLKQIPQITQKPIILRGANNNEIDKILIPILAENAPSESIIAFAEEDTYEEIVPSVIKNKHILVLRTPIDINIAKELNILTVDKGLSADRILIDPDMGGLGYGLDYGYSIIEKIRQAAFDGDTMLNMPIIAFIGEESYRAKEAKTNTFSEQWGEYYERAAMWEISGATAMMAAGANIVVLWHPQSVETLKGLV